MECDLKKNAAKIYKKYIWIKKLLCWLNCNKNQYVLMETRSLQQKFWCVEIYFFNWQVLLKSLKSTVGIRESTHDHGKYVMNSTDRKVVCQFFNQIYSFHILPFPWHSCNFLHLDSIDICYYFSGFQEAHSQNFSDTSIAVVSKWLPRCI